jgi:hypothetical protein
MFDPNRPIPRPIFETILYASGGDAAGPCAIMGEYTLSQALEYPTFRAYVIVRKNGKRVLLAQVPASDPEDWKILA